MSRTRKVGRPIGHDLGARYKCDKSYGGGTGWFPKYLAKKERRKELSICSLVG